MNIPAEAIEAAAPWITNFLERRGLVLHGKEADVLAGYVLQAAAPHIRAQEDRKLVNTWYRSLTPDGKVWCESRDPDEVQRMSKGKNCTYEKYETYEVATGWEAWDK
jgi:hypothetical protein